MDQNIMNATRGVVRQFKLGRTEQNIFQLSLSFLIDRLSKADGQTKDRVEQWRKNLYALTDDLKKQVKLLDDLDNGGTKESDGTSNMKQNYFDHLVNQLSKEILDLMTACKNILALPLKHQSKQKKDSVENQWRILIDQMKNEVTKILGYSQEQKSDNMSLLAKLLNLKDHLQKQLFQGILYKKIVIWMDLNIQGDEFVHSSKIYSLKSNFEIEVVEAINKINDFKENLKYVPSKLFYQEIDLQTPGYYSIQSEESDNVGNIEALINCFQEMESLIKKNFKLSEEKLIKFSDNNPVQITLREELELVYQQKNKLEEENQKLMLSLIENREKDSKNLLELNSMVDKLKHELQIKELENDDKALTIKNMESFQIKIKHSLKTSEDERTRLKTWYIPRLKETKRFQKELFDELEKIKQDAELLPSMFRAETVFRNQCKREKAEAEEKMKEALKQHQGLLKERNDLKYELERKERLSLQAIAARSNMKQHLDEASNQLKNSEHQRNLLTEKLKEADQQVEKFKKKHDEMFQSVSLLNKRIEELEQHKLHLLEKLKSLGDNGGLEYIVKTQQLENIKGIELLDRVKVEDYRPELNRNNQK